MNHPIYGKVLSRKATIIDRDGYITKSGVFVTDMGDTIRIGVAEHNKTDLEITEDRIVSKAGAWEVALK